MSRPCETCGSPLRHANAKRFCSHRCYWDSLKGAGSPRWKGGYVNFQGYRAISRGSRGSRVFEHRLVMEHHLGRPLEKGETVHHINGDRSDNRIENLQLLIRPPQAGVALVCGCCGSADIRATPIRETVAA